MAMECWWQRRGDEFSQPLILPRLPLDSRTSIYARIGDCLPIIACLAILAAVLAPRGAASNSWHEK